LAQIRLTGSGSETKLEGTQIAIEPTIEPDAEMERVLAKFQKVKSKR
jgi:hypothetical protein